MEIPETPVKVIKITKTIAVKVPVPYPVKVREKVPYPVPISKPYPVPVPQIIKVPHIVTTKSDGHENADAGYGSFPGTHQLGGQGNDYQVQEHVPHDSPPAVHFGSPSQSFNGYNSGHEQNLNDDASEESHGNSYGGPSSYYGYNGNNDGHESAESKSYDLAIKDYLSKHQPNGDANEGSNGYHFH